MGTRVMIVDDHQMMRQGLCSLLEKAMDVEVVGEAANGRDCLALAKQKKPDIIVMDINMPDMNGVEATRQLRKALKDVNILVLSMSTDKRQVQDALQAGAKGYIVKDSAFDELIRAIGCIMDGDSYLSPAVQGGIIDDYLSGQPVHERDTSKQVLSNRELEILQLISEGLSTKEIARRVDRCDKTIETHRSNIMAKLGIHNLPQLTKFAIQEGLTTVNL